MLLKPLLILPMLLSLTACTTASSSAVRYVSVPLQEYSKAEQGHMAAHIDLVCGTPPRCPPGSPEQWVLDYGRLRAMVRAAKP